eukprot:3428845-Ditylum_brightwellii.AAC.1
MADVGHCWQQQQGPNSSTLIEKAVEKTDRRQRVSGNSKKLVAARSKTVAVAMANQYGDAKPVKTGTGSRQEGACHT